MIKLRMQGEKIKLFLITVIRKSIENRANKSDSTSGEDRKRILPCSDWLPSGQDGSLLPARDFSVCSHKWISNVISSLI